MTDPKSTENAPSATETTVEPASEGTGSDGAAPKSSSTKSNFAKAAEGGDDKGKKPARAAKHRGRGWLWLLLLILLLGGAGTWIWFQQPQLRAQLVEKLDFLPNAGTAETSDSAAATQPPTDTPANTTAEPTQVAPERAEPESTPETFGAQHQQLQQQLQQQQRTIAQLQQQLAAVQRDVTSQGNRLGELGNTSREDWQLAEADYLLRLANQRLLIERDSRAALGLLEEVDGILRRVDLPDLYGVRQQVTRDITALKLVENIDREGLYLRLRALEEQLLRANIQPQFDLAADAAAEAEQPQGTEDSGTLQRSWQNFTRFMRQSVRIRDGEIDPVLLSPQSEARFRQSLRLNMEQAELALLRENETVYKDALNRARELLLQYAVPGNQREVLADELHKLRDEPITTELPDLAASQNALHNYIERLHKTSPENTGGNTQ